MPRLWSQIAGALGLLTLAVLVLNAGVFWILMEQNSVKRHSDLAWSLGGAMQAQLGAAIRSGADVDSLVESIQALSRTDLDVDAPELGEQRRLLLLPLFGDSEEALQLGASVCDSEHA